MRYFRFLILLFLILFSSVSLAGNYSTSMEPQFDEQLDDNIELVNLCKNVEIVEWRGTPGYFESTEPSKRSIKILNEVCNLAVQKFPNFIKSKGYQLDKPLDLKVKICMMPADVHRRGRLPRNLNDLQYRFSQRKIKYSLWGYYHRPTNYLYLRNDVLKDNMVVNRHFKTVFAHELYHVMSYTHGIYNQYPSHPDIKDEMLARDFSASLGLGR